MRLTTDTPKNNLEMALNLFYVKDKEVWVREYGKNGADISLLNLMREILSHQCPYVEPDISDDDLIMMMPEWLFDDVRSTEHVVGLLYVQAGRHLHAEAGMGKAQGLRRCGIIPAGMRRGSGNRGNAFRV